MLVRRWENMGENCRQHYSSVDNSDSLSDSGITISKMAKRVHTFPPEHHHRYGHPLHVSGVFLASSLKVLINHKTYNHDRQAIIPLIYCRCAR